MPVEKAVEIGFKTAGECGGITRSIISLNTGRLVFCRCYPHQFKADEILVNGLLKLSHFRSSELSHLYSHF